MAESGRRLDAAALLDWAHTSVGDLIAHTDEINRLNVFPVADADTGTNMLFTMRAAWAQADAAAGGGGREEHQGASDVARVAAALAGGALHGARGNSGVILSQILRGVADVAAEAATERGGELGDINGAVLASALRHAIALVVASMGESVPGTIVSVLQAAAGAAEDADSGDADLVGVVAAAGDAAVVALDKTTEQLDVLADAGVVDAGGRGLLVLLDALLRTVSGHAPTRQEYVPSPPEVEITVTAPAPPRFEVMYLLGGCAPDGVEKLRQRLDELGDSVAIAAAMSDGAGRYSVHVHSDDAGGAVEAGLPVGAPEPYTDLGADQRRQRACAGRLEPRTSGARRRRRRRCRRAVRRRRRPCPAARPRCSRPDVRGQCQAVAARPRRRRCRPGHGAAQRLCRGRGAGRRVHRRDRLGHRRRAGADRFDGAGAGRAGRPRPGPAGRRRRLHDGPGGGRGPARIGAASPPSRR